ncbi:MAG: PEP-CTERM sorting domain-containing protein [Gemmatimonadota bacterium]
MTTRTAALLAGLLLLPAAARGETLPTCPLLMTGADFWYSGRPDCRLGQFTFRDFFFDNDDGLANAFVYPIELGLFKDHLDITMHSMVPRIDYALDPLTYYPHSSFMFDWYRELFSANITADDGTKFTHSEVTTSFEAIFHVPPGGEAFASVWGGLGGGNPYGPYWNFNAGFFAVVSLPGDATEALTVSLINPSWTTSLYFTNPSVVPEPSTWALLGTGLVVVGLITWRRHPRRRFRLHS